MITMRRNTPDGEYKLDFRVSDHRHFQNNVTASVIVTVKTIAHERLINPASVRFHGILAEDFIREWNKTDSKVERFRSYIAEKLNTGKQNVDIFSVRQQIRQPGVLDIFFSVAASRHQRHETVNGLLQIHKEEVKRQTGLEILMAGINFCFIDKVQCQDSCANTFRIINQPHLVDANITSFVGLTIIGTPECKTNVRNLVSETCAEYHCYNGGHCLQKGTSLRCVCPVGFKGPRCQQTVRSFQGSGWAWLPSLHPQAENHLSLEFMTNKEVGVLFYNGPLSSASSNNVSDYISLEMRQGAPRLLMHIGENTMELLLKVKKYVNDGKWHQVDIYWNHENIRLLLDHCKSADVLEDMTVPFFNGTSCMTKKELPPFSKQLLLNSPLQIGGIYWKLLPTEMKMWDAHPSLTNFDGCLKNLFYNGQILDLSDTLLSKNTVVGCPQTEGTCRMLDCSAHGTCQADLTDTPPWCWCDAGWIGPNCSEPTQPVTFLPHSYIKFALSFDTGRFMTLVQLRFRTEESEGELFRLSDQYTNEYAILEIKQGNLYFKYNLNNKNVEEKYICLCYISVADGNWHTVKVSRYGSLSTLQLDDGEFIRHNQTSVFEGHQWLVVDKQEGVHAGGKAEYTGMDTLEIYSDFRNGCVDDVRLDGRALPLPPASNVTQWGQVTMALNLEHGCGFSSGCNFVICTEPVKCSDRLKQSNCMCSDEKVLASKSKDCATETCERNFCIDSEECLYHNTKFHYNCECPDGETGMNCKFLGDKSVFSLSAWTLTALLLVIVLIIVSATSLIGYKYLFSVHRRTEIKVDLQENEARSGNDRTSILKSVKTPINETEATVCIELQDLKGDSGPDVMECKNKIDTDLLSENRDELTVYVYEGGGTAPSSFSSLCAGLQEREPDAVNLAQRGTFCIFLEKQCQTES